MDRFWIVIGSTHLSIGIDSANVDDVTTVHSTPTADQVSKCLIPGERCGFVAFGFYGLGDCGLIGIGISEVIYEDAGGNGQSRQTEYHPSAPKASFCGCRCYLATGWPFLFLRVLKNDSSSNTILCRH